MTNDQPTSRQELDPSGLVAVHNIFYTIQGEGPFAGQPAVFIRLSGCNLQCPLCDTSYTGDRRWMNPDHVVDHLRGVSTGPTRLVVLTGGEPFRQNIEPLVRALVTEGYKVQIETNGTLHVPLPWSDVTVVCSPKTGRIHPKLLPHISAFKYVIHADHVDPLDGLPTNVLGYKGRVARPPDGFLNVYVQPVDEGSDVLPVLTNQRHLRAAVQSCLMYGYTLCLQLHKIAGLE